MRLIISRLLLSGTILLTAAARAKAQTAARATTVPSRSAVIGFSGAAVPNVGALSVSLAPTLSPLGEVPLAPALSLVQASAVAAATPIDAIRAVPTAAANIAAALHASPAAPSSLLTTSCGWLVIRDKQM